MEPGILEGWEKRRRIRQNFRVGNNRVANIVSTNGEAAVVFYRLTTIR